MKYAPREMTTSQRIGWFTGPRTPTGCREWTGTINNHGYAWLSVGNKRGNIGRHILGLKPGDGKVMMHTCDNPRCVEPSHLRVGTTRENQADKVAKRRLAFGERQGGAVLTEAIVRDIRARWKRGWSVGLIRRVLKLNYQTVLSVVDGRNWRHVK